MGRHRTREQKLELAERATRLREEGRSRREIQQELRIGDDLARTFLSGTPLPDRLIRPRAKDDVRAEAVRMRLAGATYDQIAVELGVSKGSCSLWLRDLPFPQLALPLDIQPAEPGRGAARPATGRRAAARELRQQGLLLKEIAERLDISLKTASLYTRGLPWPERTKHGGDAAHVRAMTEARWSAHRRQRDIAEQQRKLTAALQVGDVDDRTLLLLGAVAYWCEGSKSKPWRRRGTWTFINSDPLLMRLMVRWLRLVGVPPERWVLRIQIHETADLQQAEDYWRHVLGLPEVDFSKATLKRHKPLTRRKNVGSDYHGCLSIYVRQGTPLLQQVEGWLVGALLGAGGALPDQPMPWVPECETDARQSAVG